MGALVPVAPRLAKLLPRLASPHDGEVLATVAAILRTLEGAGLDLFALAEAIGEAPPKRRSLETWAELAAWCREHDGGRLTEAEARFVAQMADRLVFGGLPSERQASWLRSIYARLRVSG
jgi:hypothetical protein